MTIPQIHGFLLAIVRRKATEGAVFVSNVAVAAQGDSKGIKKAIETYVKQRDELTRKAKAKIQKKESD